MEKEWNQKWESMKQSVNELFTKEFWTDFWQDMKDAWNEIWSDSWLYDLFNPSGNQNNINPNNYSKYKDVNEEGKYTGRWTEKALGGMINGPGSETSDSIPAMLSNGEFVVNAKATQKFLPLLEAINSGDVPGFKMGGRVGESVDPSVVNRWSLKAAGLGNNQVLTYLSKVAHDTENFNHIMGLISGIESMKKEYKEQVKSLRIQQEKLQEQLQKDLESLENGQEEQTTEFTASISDLTNQMSSFFTNLGNITGNSEEGALVGGLIGAGQQGYNQYKNFQNATGLMSKVTAGFGMANAAMGAVSAIQSYNEAKNKKEEQEWERQRDLDRQQLENIKQIKQNTAETAKNIIQMVAQNPTLSNIKDASEVLEGMYNSLTGTIKPNFGKIAVKAIEKDLVFDDTYTQRFNPLSAMRKMGYDYPGNIGNMGIDELQEVYNDTQSISRNDLKRLAEITVEGGDLSSSGDLGKWSTNFDSFRNKLENYLESVEELRVAYKELAKAARYENMAGVQWLDAQEKVDQYRKKIEEMYKAAGKNINEHSNEIDKQVQKYKENIVDGGERIITVMQDVRSSFIQAFSSGDSALQSFASGLNSYFSTMKENIASLFYDINIDKIDAQFKELFGTIIDKLANYKGNNPLQFVKEIIQGGNIQKVFSNMINMVKNMENISSINDLIAEQFREQAKAAGLSEEKINKLLETMGLVSDESRKLKERLDSIKNALSNALSSALDSGSFRDFSKSMGKSIYENTKQGLIDAFMESKVYQEMFETWFEESDISFTGNLEEDFRNMQGLLDNVKQKLREAGLDFGYNEVPTGSDSDSGSDDYYAGGSTSGEGSTVVNKNYYYSPHDNNFFGSEKEELYREFLKWKDDEDDRQTD
jgi:hypothetical protein